VLDVYKKVIGYYVKEKDLRGFVEIKGWAHSSAHTAECLSSLVKSGYIKYNELLEILNIIKAM